MLTCIACSKLGGGTNDAGTLHHPVAGDDDDDDVIGGGGGGETTPSTRLAIKALTAQIKDMALKASGAYRHCKPCAGAASNGHHHHRRHYTDSEAGLSGSDRFCYSYRRAAAALGSGSSTPAIARGGMAAVSSGDATPAMSVSGRTETASSVFVVDEEEEPREWVAQVEPGVLITFISLPHGGNDLKRIRFSRQMFNKWQAQRWWAENYDRVMELYNVQRFNRQAVPLPTPPRSEDENSKMESAEDSPVTPPLSREQLPCHLHRRMNGGSIGYSSSDSLDCHCSHSHHHHHNGRHYYDSGVLASTPKLSSISGAKTETSSMDASARTSSSPEEEEMDQSGELSVSNASEQETEWVEQDEPGVYITIRALPGGIRELRRVRFSRERFGETHARLWWEENRARIHQQYL